MDRAQVVAKALALVNRTRAAIRGRNNQRTPTWFFFLCGDAVNDDEAHPSYDEQLHELDYYRFAMVQDLVRQVVEDHVNREGRRLRSGFGRGDLQERCFEWSKFLLPKDMSLKPTEQVSRLPNLAQEIKLLIFCELAPNDRIALALSCKDLMQMHDLEPLEVPKFNSHCAPWNASLKWQYDGSYLPTCRCGGLESLLLQCCPHLPTGRPAWSRQLCIDCQKWLPRRVSYWKEKADTFRNEFWDAHHDAEWMRATELFNKNLKRQCPKCYFIEQGADNDIISIWKDKERRTRMKDIEKRRAPVARRLDWTV